MGKKRFDKKAGRPTFEELEKERADMSNAELAHKEVTLLASQDNEHKIFTLFPQQST